jgi:hypothetical protein
MIIRDRIDPIRREKSVDQEGPSTNSDENVKCMKAYITDISNMLKTSEPQKDNIASSEQNHYDSTESLFWSLHKVQYDRLLREALKDRAVTVLFYKVKAEVIQKVLASGKTSISLGNDDIADSTALHVDLIEEQKKDIAEEKESLASNKSVPPKYCNILYKAAQFVKWQLEDPSSEERNNHNKQTFYKRALKAQSVPILGMIPSAAMAVLNTLGIVQKVAERAFHNFRWAISYVKNDVKVKCEIESILDANTQSLRRLRGLVANSVTNFFTAGLLNFAASCAFKRPDPTTTLPDNKTDTDTSSDRSSPDLSLPIETL